MEQLRNTVNFVLDRAVPVRSGLTRVLEKETVDHPHMLADLASAASIDDVLKWYVRWVGSAILLVELESKR